ncbi:ParB/RepB/Spo0J family partition protein [Ideonella paludis]|uniref:ParB/RepB/Spo0J family partition protein n=1 Tax=Ideonella paludis TaxID=1233411 RepID=A0ABS5E399_9BURK|nr:ParB/RepB/Spo0J family partition protein [Ideonella paludis]MBQ0937887.1 ParB/RepB/Spo0J family partition protein [Ideonella paludis]
MSKKLAAKAMLAGLNLPPSSAQTRPDGVVERPKTAPGSMLQFMSNQSAAMKEAEELKDRLREFDGASVVRRIDPAEIAPSRWANRHAASFEAAEFAALKEEIAGSGGNVQPIRVRPSRVKGDGAKYEVVFGHRRHRACLELGLPVLAMIEDATDQQLFEAMERENRSRKNLSAWEQGCMYRRALDEGLYPSLRRIAEAVQVDLSLVSKSVALARLPELVVSAFPSPLDIQFRWAQPLGDAVQKDPDGIIERAKQLKSSSVRLSPAQVLEALVATTPSAAKLEKPAVRKVGKGSRAATIKSFPSGAIEISLASGALDPEQEKAFISLLDEFLSRG